VRPGTANRANLQNFGATGTLKPVAPFLSPLATHLTQKGSIQ
jgi:hypothetical protein